MYAHSPCVLAVLMHVCRDVFCAAVDLGMGWFGGGTWRERNRRSETKTKGGLAMRARMGKYSGPTVGE